MKGSRDQGAPQDLSISCFCPFPSPVHFLLDNPTSTVSSPWNVYKSCDNDPHHPLPPQGTQPFSLNVDVNAVLQWHAQISTHSTMGGCLVESRLVQPYFTISFFTVWPFSRMKTTLHFICCGAHYWFLFMKFTIAVCSKKSRSHLMITTMTMIIIIKKDLLRSVKHSNSTSTNPKHKGWKLLDIWYKGT